MLNFERYMTTRIVASLLATSHLRGVIRLAVPFHGIEGRPGGKDTGSVGPLIGLLGGALGAGGGIRERENDGLRATSVASRSFELRNLMNQNYREKSGWCV